MGGRRRSSERVELTLLWLCVAAVPAVTVLPVVLRGTPEDAGRAKPCWRHIREKNPTLAPDS